MVDIVERLKQKFSGMALQDVADQIQVYVKERHEAADEIERLRRDVDRMASLAIDNARDTLRLREALKNMLRWHDQLSPADIAKAEAALKEGNNDFTA